MTPSSPTLLTVNEAAARLSVSPRTLRRWIAAGEFSHYRMGRSIRIEADAVTRFLSRSLKNCIWWR